MISHFLIYHHTAIYFMRAICVPHIECTCIYVKYKENFISILKKYIVV